MWRQSLKDFLALLLDTPITKKINFSRETLKPRNTLKIHLFHTQLSRKYTKPELQKAQEWNTGNLWTPRIKTFLQEGWKWFVVDPLWEQEGNENNLKRSIRVHIKGLSLCMIWEHKKCLIIPALLSARITEEPPPRWARDKHHLSPEQMRKSTKSPE